MKKQFKTLGHTSIALLAGSLMLQAGANYKLLTTYPVPGTGTGTFDYITVDSAARRLYLSHQTRVEVLDADTGKAVGAITDTPGVHGAVIVSKFHHGFTTNGAEAKVSMFDTKTLKVIKKTDVGAEPDSFVYDAGSGRVFVSNHGPGEITAIDPKSGNVVGVLKAGGPAEQMVSGGDGLMYANIEQPGELLVFDPKTLEMKNHFPVEGCTQPSGLAIDTTNLRLFIGCRSKNLLVMDGHDGRIITSMPIGARNDNAWFDPQQRLIFASNGEGMLNIFHQKSADEYEDAGAVTTEPNAKTSTLDAKTGKVYLLSGEFETIPAADPSQKPKRKVKEGTYKVLVVGR
jgi:DNA-binding beta-propeller fold protein YncE